MPFNFLVLSFVVSKTLFAHSTHSLRQQTPYQKAADLREPSYPFKNKRSEVKGEHT